MDEPMIYDENGDGFHTQAGADLSRILTHYSADRDGEIAAAVQGLDVLLNSLEDQVITTDARAAIMQSDHAKEIARLEKRIEELEKRIEELERFIRS